jgi:hypothetical protein
MYGRVYTRRSRGPGLRRLPEVCGDRTSSVPLRSRIRSLRADRCVSELSKGVDGIREV